MNIAISTKAYFFFYFTYFMSKVYTCLSENDIKALNC